MVARGGARHPHVHQEMGRRGGHPRSEGMDEDWGAHELSHPLLSTLCVDLGYQWAAWPKEYGGGGMNAMMSSLCLEEISRADLGLATAASCSVWAMSPIMPPRENRPLMELFTPEFLSDERWYVGSAAITDGRGGSDVENLDGTHGRHIATTAKRSGDEAFAIIYVPSDTPGVTQGGPYRKAGMSGESNSDVWFDDVRVPVEYRAHGPYEDALAARAFICSGNVGTGAQCIGVMRGVYELVRDWCDTRVVGGKVLKEHTITAGVLADIVV